MNDRMMNDQSILGVLNGDDVCGSFLRAVNVWSADPIRDQTTIWIY